MLQMFNADILHRGYHLTCSSSPNSVPQVLSLMRASAPSVERFRSTHDSECLQAGDNMQHLDSGLPAHLSTN